LDTGRLYGGAGLRVQRFRTGAERMDAVANACQSDGTRLWDAAIRRETFDLGGSDISTEEFVE
jgi:hypothetical protein